MSFSTLPAILSPRAAQILSPATRVVENRLPAYLQSHGAFRDNNRRRNVGGTAAFSPSSPTPMLGYGPLRVRQVGLAPTLSLLMGLPIPFNSMGRIIADLVPSLASFVPECARAVPGEPGSSSACDRNEGKPCNALPMHDEAASALAIRCSDLAYITQLHHIVAWQQHRAIAAHASVTGNDAVLTDPQFAAAKSQWLRLYSALDKEVKALPAAAHIPLTLDATAPIAGPAGPGVALALPPLGSETAEAELLFHISRLAKDAADSDARKGKGGQAAPRKDDDTAGSLAFALPSLVPYLLASAEFSQEALLASVRQLGTFNMLLMLCGTLLTLSSLLILLFAVLGLRQPSADRSYQTPKGLIASGLPEAATVARWLWGSACVGGGTWATGWATSEILKYLQVGPAAAADALVWRQLPVLCATGALCSLVIPFARCGLRRFLNSTAPFKLPGEVPTGEAEPLVMDKHVGWGLTGALRREMCLSRLWLWGFGGGTFLFYASLFALCIVPFSDCLVNRECSVVRFLIGIYCISAGLTVYATPSSYNEKKHIVSA